MKPSFVKVVGRLLAVVCEYDVDSCALETSGNVCTPGGECGDALLTKNQDMQIHLVTFYVTSYIKVKFCTRSVSSCQKNSNYFGLHYIPEINSSFLT